MTTLVLTIPATTKRQLKSGKRRNCVTWMELEVGYCRAWSNLQVLAFMSDVHVRSTTNILTIASALNSLRHTD